MLESNLTNLEKKIDDLLASFEAQGSAQPETNPHAATSNQEKTGEDGHKESWIRGLDASCTEVSLALLMSCVWDWHGDESFAGGKFQVPSILSRASCFLYARQIFYISAATVRCADT